MIIKELKITKQPTWPDKRCDMIVSPSSKWREGKCKRFALYQIEDKFYCRQHAGEECLDYYLLTNKEKP